MRLSENLLHPLETKSLQPLHKLKGNRLIGTLRPSGLIPLANFSYSRLFLFLNQDSASYCCSIPFSLQEAGQSCLNNAAALPQTLLNVYPILKSLFWGAANSAIQFRYQSRRLRLRPALYTANGD